MTALYLIQSRVTKEPEKHRRRRQRQRRRQRKQQKGPEPPMDDELTMHIQSWSVHEPKQSTPEEGCEPEQMNLTEIVVDSTMSVDY